MGYVSPTQHKFEFLTLKPGAYPAGHSMLSPHIHFDIAGKYDRLITQMHFPRDRWLKQDKTPLHDISGEASPMPDRIFGKLTPGGSKLDAAATLCQFDVVLQDG